MKSTGCFSWPVRAARHLLPALLALFVSLHAFGQERDWPRWRGPNGDGISRETAWDPHALVPEPRILWEARVGPGFSNVVVSGGRLYTLGGDYEKDALFCLDAKTGKEKWVFRFPYASKGYGPLATPTVDGDRVYTLGAKGHLSCFSASGGKPLWSLNLVRDLGVVAPYYGFSGSPVVEGDLLVITGNSSGIALDKANGRKVWASSPVEGEFMYDMSGSEYAAPVIYTFKGVRHALVFNTFGLSSVDVGSGTRDWDFAWPSEKRPGGRWAHAADPVVSGAMVFISAYCYSGVDVGCALLDMGSGRPRALWAEQEPEHVLQFRRAH